MNLVPISVTDGNKTYYFRGSLLGHTVRSNSITEYPTVEGTSFTDHYYREPESASFEVHASEISKSLVYVVELDDFGNESRNDLTVEEVTQLIENWFKHATRVRVVSIRFEFKNMILQSYSWADENLSVFNPTLTFKEAKVQGLRSVVVSNVDQYYKASYGETQNVGGATAYESPENLASVGATIGGYAIAGAAIGSFIPVVGTGVGALVGAGVGVLANFNKVSNALQNGLNGCIGALNNWFGGGK